MTDTLIASHLPKRWVAPIAIGGLLLVILYALGVLGGGEKTRPGTTETAGTKVPAGALTLTLAGQPAENVLSWQGTVRSRYAVQLAPKISARIVEIPVRPGDRLKKGAVIAKLDGRDLRAANNAANAALAAAQARAGQAKADEQRAEELFEKQAITRQNYDAALAQSRSAQAIARQAASQAQQSRVLLGEDTVVAPFDGIVGERMQDPGDLGTPGQAIVTFHKPEDFRLEAAIPENCIGAVKLGMPVNVRVDAVAQTLGGTIDEITPEVDPSTRSQQIKVRLPKTPGLQHGQFGWLQLACQTEPQSAILVPATAIIHYGQLQAVRVVVNGGIHIRHIRTGKRYGNKLEVLSGLREGDTILANGGVEP